MTSVELVALVEIDEQLRIFARERCIGNDDRRPIPAYAKAGAHRSSDGGREDEDLVAYRAKVDEGGNSEGEG